MSLLYQTLATKNTDYCFRSFIKANPLPLRFHHKEFRANGWTEEPVRLRINSYTSARPTLNIHVAMTGERKGWDVSLRWFGRPRSNQLTWGGAGAAKGTSDRFGCLRQSVHGESSPVRTRPGEPSNNATHPHDVFRAQINTRVFALTN